MVEVCADQAVAAEVTLTQDAGVDESVDLLLDALFGDGAFGVAEGVGELGQAVFAGAMIRTCG